MSAAAEQVRYPDAEHLAPERGTETRREHLDGPLRLVDAPRELLADDPA